MNTFADVLQLLLAIIQIPKEKQVSIALEVYLQQICWILCQEPLEVWCCHFTHLAWHKSLIPANLFQSGARSPQYVTILQCKRYNSEEAIVVQAQLFKLILGSQWVGNFRFFVPSFTRVEDRKLCLVMIKFSWLRSYVSRTIRALSICVLEQNEDIGLEKWFECNIQNCGIWI